MIKTITQFLNNYKERSFPIILIMWVFIGVEAQLWWRDHFYGIALATAVIGYSLLLLILPAWPSKTGLTEVKASSSFPD